MAVAKKSVSDKTEICSFGNRCNAANAGAIQGARVRGSGQQRSRTLPPGTSVGAAAGWHTEVCI